MLLKEYILFIGYLHYLSVHFHSCYFHIQYHGGIREITSMPVQIFYYIINTTKKHQTLLYHVRTYDRKKGPDLNVTPPPLPPVHCFQLRPCVGTYFQQLSRHVFSKVIACFKQNILKQIYCKRPSTTKQIDRV